MTNRAESMDMSDLLPLVAELTEKYTSKESSSISYDKARQLMGAVLYCIHEKEISLGKTEEILPFHEKPDAKKMYQQGYELVLKKATLTKELFHDMIMDFNAFGNQNYYDTVVVGMPEFFKYYDAKFHPQNHILTLDYPTLIPVEPMCGVDAIYQYLTYIRVEQIFLKKFPEEYVREVLLSYHNEYEQLYCNLCNIVLRNVMGCMIAEKKLTKCGYSEEDYAKIKAFVVGKKKKEVKEKLVQLLQRLMEQGYQGNQELYMYLLADMEDFAVTLMNTTENNCIEAVFSV